MPEIMIKGCECERCGHIWRPVNQDKKPSWCPKCNSPYWDKKRQKEVNEND